MSAALLLWDIDGTLVNMDRAGEKALLTGIRELYGRDLGNQLPIDLRGKTDSSIHRDLLLWLGLEATPEEERRLRGAHLDLLPKMLPLGRPYIYPGVRAALDAVHRHPELHQGLLTGNLREGAQMKLTHLGLWDYFAFGAFADDSYVRDDLGPIAVARAEKQLGRSFALERIYVIGDTPRDIACGKAFGARTIAVATGAFSQAELEALGPTHAFEDLQDKEALLQVVL